MELEVIRISSGTDSTNGILFETVEQGNDIDGSWRQKKFLAYTLEDEYRSEKNMEKQEYQTENTNWLLETLVDIMRSIQNVFLTFILGCFTLLMCLVLSIFLYIVVTLTSIQLGVSWLATPKKTTKSRRTVL